MRALILSGGAAHEYRDTSSALASILGQAGFEASVTEDPDVLASLPAQGLDLLALNCARWTCDQNPEWYAEWHYSMRRENGDGLACFLASGGGLLAIHAATICFDDWPEYRRILGAWWEWGVSGHAPYQRHRMRVAEASHPIMEGLHDFEIEDELYTYPRVFDVIDPLLTADWQGDEHPMLWVRKYGDGRVCYCALGHDLKSFQNPSFGEILRHSAMWVCGVDPGKH
jgi:type 1 glutamine amidotransferase